MILTHDQIATLWVQMGGRRGKNGSVADMAAAIALAESGGDTNKDSPPNHDGSIDRGLFQINSSHGALSTETIDKNIKAAILISANGTNWRPWTTAWEYTITNGIVHLIQYEGPGAPYKAHLTGGYTPQDIQIRKASDGSVIVTNSQGKNLENQQIESSGTPESGIDVGAGGNAEPGAHVSFNPLSWAKALGAVLSHLLSGQWWLRVGQAALGLLMVLLGLGLIFRKDAAALIPKVVPV